MTNQLDPHRGTSQTDAGRDIASAALGSLKSGLFAFFVGGTIGVIGDACHVASGTTTYLWPAVPVLWRSAVWFPLLVGLSILGVAQGGSRVGLPSVPRTRNQLLTAICAVSAFYAYTATLRGQVPTVSVVQTAAIALAFWRVWDPSWRCFAMALVSALVGPAAEIGFVSIGAVRYAADSSALWGVAPWLPCLYFAACAVASGLWRTLTEEPVADMASSSLGSSS